MYMKLKKEMDQIAKSYRKEHQLKWMSRRMAQPFTAWNQGWRCHKRCLDVVFKEH